MGFKVCKVAGLADYCEVQDSADRRGGGLKQHVMVLAVQLVL